MPRGNEYEHKYDGEKCDLDSYSSEYLSSTSAFSSYVLVCFDHQANHTEVEMNMKRKIFILWFVILLIASAATGSTTLDWEVIDTLQLDATPLDVAIASDGKTVFVLTQKGSIQIYEVSGRLTDKIEVGEQIDHIQLSPNGEQLFATSRQSKTVKVIALEFINQIETKGSPYKGSENAPVVIADFSDFE